MNRLRSKILAAVVTFTFGVSCAYLVQVIYSRPSIAPLDLSTPEFFPARTASFSATEYQETTIEEDWQNLMKAKGCLVDPRFQLLNYLSSFKSDERKAVAFLISRIPESRGTQIHVSPFGLALEGEVAIYCLQDAFDMPWYMLKPEYASQVKKSLSAEYPNDYQSLLQRKIKSPKRSKELMDSWKKYYEGRVSSGLGN